MIGQFDEAGDLWIEAAVIGSEGLPAHIVDRTIAYSASPPTSPGCGLAAHKFNLTAYIRHLMKPDWLNAALTSSSANITIQQHKDWLATIPEPIEPNARPS